MDRLKRRRDCLSAANCSQLPAAKRGIKSGESVYDQMAAGGDALATERRTSKNGGNQRKRLEFEFVKIVA